MSKQTIEIFGKSIVADLQEVGEKIFGDEKDYSVTITIYEIANDGWQRRIYHDTKFVDTIEEAHALLNEKVAETTSLLEIKGTGLLQYEGEFGAW